MKNKFDSFSQIFEESYSKGSNAIISPKMIDPVEGLAQELKALIGNKVYISSGYRDEYNQARVVYNNWLRAATRPNDNKIHANKGESYLKATYRDDVIAKEIADAYAMHTTTETYYTGIPAATLAKDGVDLPAAPADKKRAKEESIAAAKKVLDDLMAKGKYMSNHQLQGAIDVSGLTQAEYKKVYDFITGTLKDAKTGAILKSNFADKALLEPVSSSTKDHVHIKVNVGGDIPNVIHQTSTDDKKPKKVIKTDKIKSTKGLLSKGDIGPQVKAVQRKLLSLGYGNYLGTWGDHEDGIDGSFGSSTKDAVIEFQKNTWPKDSTQWDGIVGPNTSQALKDTTTNPQKVELSGGLKLSIYPSPGSQVAAAILTEKINTLYNLSDALNEYAPSRMSNEQYMDPITRDLARSLGTGNVVTRFGSEILGSSEPRLFGIDANPAAYFTNTQKLATHKAGIDNEKAMFSIVKKDDNSYIIYATNPTGEVALGNVKQIDVKKEEDIKKIDDASKIKNIVKKAKKKTKELIKKEETKQAELSQEELDELNSIDTKIEPMKSLPKLKNGSHVRKNIKLIEKALRAEGINNPYAIIAILGVVGKESGFNNIGERGGYSKGRLPEVWGAFDKRNYTGKEDKITRWDLADKKTGHNWYNDLAKKWATIGGEGKTIPELFDFLYGTPASGELGYRHPDSKFNYKSSVYKGKGKGSDRRYGNTSPGDGYKYRGGGFNQLTFKGSYENMGKEVGMDLMGGATGSVIGNPQSAAKVTAKFFKKRFGSDSANFYGAKDHNSFTSQDQADRSAAHANTGWGKPEPHSAIKSTKEFTPHFTFKKEEETGEETV
jgi:predicted chitinase/peptidoglycan hydrolase-like protein with peptidoglycan-binding domain